MRRERMVLMLISLLSLLLPQSALAAQAVDCVMVQEETATAMRPLASEASVSTDRTAKP